MAGIRAPVAGGQAGRLMFAELRARAWQIATAVCAALAVAAVVAFLVVRANAAGDRIRADAAEQRAQAAEGQVRALREAAKRDDVASEATTVARDSAAKRQPVQEARAAKVKSYADSAADACRADPRIVRELSDGEGRFRQSEDRLRGNGQPEGKAADHADD